MTKADNFLDKLGQSKPSWQDDYRGSFFKELLKELLKGLAGGGN